MVLPLICLDLNVFSQPNDLCPMLKVVFCTDGIFPHEVGGMQRHSRLLIEALAMTGEVELVVIHPHQDVEIFEGFANVREIALPPLPEKKHYFLELRDYSKLVLAEVKKLPDHLIYSQGLSIWSGMKEVADRTIVNPHGLEPYQTLDWKAYLKTWPYRIVFNRLFRRCRYTIALGGRLTDILRTRVARSDQLVVLPNATNPVRLPDEDLVKTPEGPLKFMFVGRFAYNKGIDVLLKAVNVLNEEGLQDRFELDLCGKGPLYEAMKSDYPLPNARFRGFVSDEDLEQAYLDNHVFVLPTLFEGMPTVVLEGMARAMPVIVTDVGATLELVGPENGLIIRKKDVDHLAEAMRKIIKMDPRDLAQLSKRSLEKFQARFTWEAVAREHLNLFKGLS